MRKTPRPTPFGMFSPREAATYLRIPHFEFQRMVAKYPFFQRQSGFHKMFAKSDLDAIKEALRCRSHWFRPSKVKLHTTTLEELISPDMSVELRGLLAELLRRPYSKNSNAKSNAASPPE